MLRVVTYLIHFGVCLRYHARATLTQTHTHSLAPTHTHITHTATHIHIIVQIAVHKLKPTHTRTHARTHINTHIIKKQERTGMQKHTTKLKRITRYFLV